MTSALQKLFRKRISKQQVQDQRRKQEIENAKKLVASQSIPRSETQPYLTVGSLNSPSSSQSHFGFSSKASLGSYVAHEDEGKNGLPIQKDQMLSEQDSSGLSQYTTRPRAASLSAQSMLRDLSDSSQGWRTSSNIGSELTMDQFGSFQKMDQGNQMIPLSANDGGHPEGGGIEINPIYISLTQRKELQQDWYNAKLVLVPSGYENIGDNLLNNDDYVALHALFPSNLFKDQYISTRSKANTRDNDFWSGITLTATLAVEAQKIHLVFTRLAGPSGRQSDIYECSASVVNETTVYRTLSNQESSLTLPNTSSTLGQKRNRRERIRIRILTIEDVVIPDEVLVELGIARTLVVDSTTINHSNDFGKRKPPSEGPIAFPQSSPQLSELANSPSSLPTTPGYERFNEFDAIPHRRQFLADLAFLLDPPKELLFLRKYLHAALDFVVKASREFTTAYVYVSGFDAYNVSRIRKGVLSKAWQILETYKDDESVDGWPNLQRQLGAESRSNLLLLLENVVMGHCHGKIYPSIQAVYRNADEIVDNVVCTYQELQVSLKDFGVASSAICRRPALLDRAIFILKHLGDADEEMEHLIAEPNVQMIRMLAKQGNLCEKTISNDEHIFYTPERNRGRIRTPLDVLDVLQETLEEIGSALARAQKSGLDRKGSGPAAFGADELLPVLAYVLLRAGSMKLMSLLYYTRQFGLSDATSSRASWALVTLDAAVDYLRKDPLGLCSSQSPTSTSSICSPKSQPTSFHSPASKSSMQMERQTSLDRWSRERRSSLPGSILLSPTRSEQGDSIHNNKQHSRTSSDILFHVNLLEQKDDSTVHENEFKIPGRPASAFSNFSRSRGTSSLDVVGEDGYTASKGPPDTPYSHRRPNSSLSKRTTSMSGSGDLLIRPQIVVRPKMSSTNRSPATSTSSYEQTTMIAAKVESQSRDYSLRTMERTLSLDNSRMSRTGSEDSPNRFGKNNIMKGSSAIQVPKQLRRKSLDSWTAFSFFQGGSLLSTPENGGDANSESELSPTNSVQGHSSLQIAGLPHVSSSSSSSWLSSWTTDWNNQKGKSVQGGHVDRLNSDSNTRSTSITSNEGMLTPFNSWTFPSSLTAGGSLPCHDSDNTISDITTVRSNSSSGHSFRNQTQSDEVHSTERRAARPSSRSRLLSISTPAEPLPPQVYQESATGDYFHTRHNFQFPPPPSSSSSSSTSPMDIASQLTPRSLRQGKLLNATFLPPPSIGKIQIPTPVDEITDPMNVFKSS